MIKYNAKNDYWEVFAAIENKLQMIGEISHHPIKGWIFLNHETYEYWYADELKTMLRLINEHCTV